MHQTVRLCQLVHSGHQAPGRRVRLRVSALSGQALTNRSFPSSWRRQVQLQLQALLFQAGFAPTGHFAFFATGYYFFCTDWVSRQVRVRLCPSSPGLLSDHHLVRLYQRPAAPAVQLSLAAAVHFTFAHLPSFAAVGPFVSCPGAGWLAPPSFVAVCRRCPAALLCRRCCCPAVHLAVRVRRRAPGAVRSPSSSSGAAVRRFFVVRPDRRPSGFRPLDQACQVRRQVRSSGQVRPCQTAADFVQLCLSSWSSRLPPVSRHVAVIVVQRRRPTTICLPLHFFHLSAILPHLHFGCPFLLSFILPSPSPPFAVPSRRARRLHFCRRRAGICICRFICICRCRLHFLPFAVFVFAAFAHFAVLTSSLATGPSGPFRSGSSDRLRRPVRLVQGTRTDWSGALASSSRRLSLPTMASPDVRPSGRRHQTFRPGHRLLLVPSD